MMKLQFDANQPYQLDAIAAMTDLFEGQPQGAPEYSVIQMGDWGGMFAGQEQTELGIGNQMLLSSGQAARQCPQSCRPGTTLIYPIRPFLWRRGISLTLPPTQPGPARISQWRWRRAPARPTSICARSSNCRGASASRNSSSSSRAWPSAKACLKNIEITAEHFRALYNNLPFEHFVYDAKKVNRLRQFAVSNTLQILIINIDAFRKNFTGTEEEQKSNVIYKESDKLSGRQPIEFVQAARPIVIIDEPQSVDSTEKAQEAIRALNPLCTLRYSATHRNPYNLVYRLDPVRAFELRLVKQIVVANAAAEGGANDAFVRVEQIDYKKGIKAKLRIHTSDAGRPEGEVLRREERRGFVPAFRRASRV